MKRAIATTILLILLAPGLSAAEMRTKELRFEFRKFFKRIVIKVSTLDEILTGGKP